MKISKWIEEFKKHEKCPMCGSDRIYPTITPYPYKFTAEHITEANKKRGIAIICSDCGAFTFIDANYLEN